MNNCVRGLRKVPWTASRIFMAAALLLATTTVSLDTASANSRVIPITTTGGTLHLQPPSYRLNAMGELTLSVRDENTEINLWDFGGVTAGAGIDNDSTSVKLWARYDRTTLDQTATNGPKEQIHKNQTVLGATESILRFSETLALGADLGVGSFSRADPYGDGTNKTESTTLPAALLFGSGRLAGPVLWGLSGLFYSDNIERHWWENVVNNDEVEIANNSVEIRPPNFFVPTTSSISVTGIGGSAAYHNLGLGSAAFYLNFRQENINWAQDDVRNVYNTHEPRDIFTWGTTFIVAPERFEWLEFGIDLGAEEYSSIENYRFTVSGGTTDDPFQGRGNRAALSSRTEFFTFRFLSDIPGTKLTLGGNYKVDYVKTGQSPAEESFQDFNNFILGAVAADTLTAPQLVFFDSQEHRIIEFGVGGSYKLRDDQVTIGAEYRFFRDANVGTKTNRRPQSWEIRTGGEYLISPKWTARLGWRHLDQDNDRLTPENEWVRDRLTLGGAWVPKGGWTVDVFLAIDWWRTGYTDPAGAGGSGTGFGLMGSKLF